MPEHLAPQVWWGDTLGQTAVSAWPSGHARLDAHLPGGGWPRQAMTEVLQPPGLAAGSPRLVFVDADGCMRHGWAYRLDGKV